MYIVAPKVVAVHRVDPGFIDRDAHGVVLKGVVGDGIAAPLREVHPKPVAREQIVREGVPSGFVQKCAISVSMKGVIDDEIAF